MKDQSNRKADDSGGMSRREALTVISAVGAATLAGCGPGGADDSEAALRAPDPGAVSEDPNAVSALDCVVTPEQTEGPYFVDAWLNRSDIRSDPTTGAISDGVPLRLRINVRRVDGNTCTPIEGATVDVWQCDALGVYSDVRDIGGQFDTRGEKFLRGYQVTSRDGTAEFLTIYPGWYQGRAVHVHVKIYTRAKDDRGHEFTSQLYFDDELTDRVQAQLPYSTKGPRDTRNDQDYIYRAGNSGSRLLLHLIPEDAGYAGTISVGLKMT